MAVLPEYMHGTAQMPFPSNVPKVLLYAIQGALRAGHKCFVIFAKRLGWLHGRGRPRQAGREGRASYCR